MERAGGFGFGKRRKIEAQEEWGDENWEASHGASLQGWQGLEAEEGLGGANKGGRSANRATGVRGILEAAP